MLIACPNCKTRFAFAEDKIGVAGVKLRCNKCQTIFRLVKKTEETPKVAARAPQPETRARVKVVVANESKAFCDAVKKVLSKEPFDVLAYNDGKEAMASIEKHIPDAVLLDVALPSMYGFEVCEAIRKQSKLKGVKVILIASIYDKTRYKRSPQSLYGADDYIEKHHIPDSLAAMIYRLVGTQQALDTPAEVAAPAGPVPEEIPTAPEKISRKEMAAQEATRQVLKEDEERVTTTATVPSPPELPEACQKARRLARIIVSDISLYNQAKVEEGIRRNTFYEILADDIQEGRALYERRIPPEVREGTAFLDEAFADLIAKKQREMKL